MSANRRPLGSAKRLLRTRTSIGYPGYSLAVFYSSKSPTRTFGPILVARTDRNVTTGICSIAPRRSSRARDVRLLGRNPIFPIVIVQEPLTRVNGTRGGHYAHKRIV